MPYSLEDMTSKFGTGQVAVASSLLLVLVAAACCKHSGASPVGRRAVEAGSVRSVAIMQGY